MQEMCVQQNPVGPGKYLTQYVPLQFKLTPVPGPSLEVVCGAHKGTYLFLLGSPANPLLCLCLSSFLHGGGQQVLSPRR